MCKIVSRIKQIASNEGITIGAMERIIGASKGVLSRAINNGTDIQSKWLMALVENYPQYSSEWLLTGIGDMIKEQSQVPMTISGKQKQIITGNGLEAGIEAFTEATMKTPGSIPLVSVKAVGGFTNGHFIINKKDILAYYDIPKFRHLGVDFMIEVIGDSMIPHFYPGDIVVCSKINNPRFIQWNKCYLIASREEGLLVKRLMPGHSDDFFCAVSDNTAYPPFEIPKEDIEGLARIIGSVHLE